MEGANLRLNNAASIWDFGMIGSLKYGHNFICLRLPSRLRFKLSRTSIDEEGGAALNAMTF